MTSIRMHSLHLEIDRVNSEFRYSFFVCLIWNKRKKLSCPELIGPELLYISYYLFYPDSLGGVVCSHEISLFVRKYLFEFIIINFSMHQKTTAINFLLSQYNRSRKNT